MRIYPRNDASGPFIAKSASDRDPNWHVWLVEDSRGLNVISLPGGQTLVSKELAVLLADAWNRDGVLLAGESEA